MLPLVAQEPFSQVSLPNSPGRGNGVEGPEQLAGPDVEGANQALGVVVRHDRHAFLERRADDHDVLHHQRRRVQAGLAGFQIDLLAGAGNHADLQVHHAVLAEAGDQLAGLGVQLDQPVAGGDEDDAVVALAVGPVGDAAAGKLARRDGRALAFAQAVDPDQLAGLGVQRDHRRGACRRWCRSRH